MNYLTEGRWFMSLDYLDFERPIAELQEKIRELHRIGIDQDVNISEEVSRLEAKCETLSRSIFKDLSAQQIVQLARHPLRPYTKDYIDLIFTEFEELHGDRHSAEAAAIVGGMANFNNRSVMVIGHQKGRSTKEKLYRNFGMPNPAGFRKALRLMKLAEKFCLPVITFIDTPGAYPGIKAEEQNQSEAIARNLYEMSQLKTPIISCVIGEGCSGGALGIGVADRIIMLQYSYYSVISPEGCASILWKSADRASDAAEALCLTSDKLYKHQLINEIIEEPLGGAHRDPSTMADAIARAISENLNILEEYSLEDLLQKRYEKLVNVGQ